MYETKNNCTCHYYCINTSSFSLASIPDTDLVQETAVLLASLSDTILSPERPPRPLPPRDTPPRPHPPGGSGDTPSGVGDMPTELSEVSQPFQMYCVHVHVHYLLTNQSSVMRLSIVCPTTLIREMVGIYSVHGFLRHLVAEWGPYTRAIDYW